MSTERAARPPIRRRDADPAVTDALTTTAPQCVDHDSYAHHTTAPPENGHLLLAHLGSGPMSERTSMTLPKASRVHQPSVSAAVDHRGVVLR